MQDHQFHIPLKGKSLTKRKPFNPVTGVCRLCLKEKYYILYNRQDCSLNSRDELFGHCPHKRDHLLYKIKEGVTWTTGTFKKISLSFNTSYHFNPIYVNFLPQNWKQITVSDESLRMKKYCNTVNFIMKFIYCFDKCSLFHNLLENSSRLLLKS